MNIDIASRYISAFGSVMVANDYDYRNNQSNEDYGIETFTSESEDFEDITIGYDGKELKFGFQNFKTYGTSQVEVLPGQSESSKIFAPPPLVSFSREKNLIITQLNGDSVEVVERWNNNAWEIKMQGILIDMKNHHYPTNEVEKLVRMFNYNNVLEVSGTQFYEKGIDFMYVKSIDINGVEGFADTVQFSLNARSIKDIGFKLNE